VLSPRAYSQQLVALQFYNHIDTFAVCALTLTCILRCCFVSCLPYAVAAAAGNTMSTLHLLMCALNTWTTSQTTSASSTSSGDNMQPATVQQHCSWSSSAAAQLQLAVVYTALQIT
jgi:hypothetical protein